MGLRDMFNKDKKEKEKRENSPKATPASSTSGGAAPARAPVAPPAPPKAPPVAEVIRKQRERIAIMEKNENYIAAQMEQETTKAKAYLAKGDKRNATMCLKKKKALEGQLNNLTNTRFNLEQQVMTLQSASSNKDTVDVLNEGNQALNKIHAEISVEKVDDVMANMEDAMADANDIQQALGQTVMGGQYIDDDELLAELGELEGLNMEEKLSAGPAIPGAVPGKQVPAKAAKPKMSEEDELAALEASLGM